MVKIGERFGPDKALLKLYYVYLTIPATICLVVISVANLLAFLYLGADVALVVTIFLYAAFLLAVLLILFWIPRYFRSITFLLEANRIVFDRGVWWKRKSYVPYNRITNVDVVQGPLSRIFGLGKILIQTAGYSAATGGSSNIYAEIAIFGVKNFEEIKDTVLKIVSERKPVAVEVAPESYAGDVDIQILLELRRIRELLETQQVR
ncbi:MAG: PH domain-containing protein [Armatimonadota bacterium]